MMRALALALGLAAAAPCAANPSETGRLLDVLIAQSGDLQGLDRALSAAFPGIELMHRVNDQRPVQPLDRHWEIRFDLPDTGLGGACEAFEPWPRDRIEEMLKGSLSEADAKAAKALLRHPIRYTVSCSVALGADQETLVEAQADVTHWAEAAQTRLTPAAELR